MRRMLTLAYDTALIVVFAGALPQSAPTRSPTN